MLLIAVGAVCKTKYTPLNHEGMLEQSIEHFYYLSRTLYYPVYSIVLHQILQQIDSFLPVQFFTTVL